ncbi:hypothetical protein AB1K91_06175 [Terribacillus sp. 179-K 1B1 HS]|uniref:hypothetical protein n=1 Tax=Terribacillus sp. 179-K 1B1 HS TaxID=3142388 RepID=UPI0039A37C86
MKSFYKEQQLQQLEDSGLPDLPDSIVYQDKDTYIDVFGMRWIRFHPSGGTPVVNSSG